MKKAFALPAIRKSADGLWQRINPFGDTTPRELSLFCQQFGIMFSAGVDIITCLDILDGEGRNPRFRRAIGQLKQSIQQGLSLSSAASRLPQSFPPLFIAMVKAGELGGSLDRILSNLGNYFEEQADIRSQTFHTLLYPVIVLVIAIAVIIFLLSSVVPIFISIFESMDAPIPQATQILIAVSSGFTRIWPFLLGLVLLIPIIAKRIPEESGLRWNWDRFTLSLPIAGPRIYYADSIRFCQSLAILLENGVELMTALTVVEQVIHNRFTRSRFVQARLDVRQGKRLADSLKDTRIIKPDFYQMVRVGEQSGSLDQVLFKIADYYKSENERRLKTLMTAAEPAILVVVGLFVMAIALSIMTPIYQMYNSYANIL